MAEKKIKTRIQQKHDVEANWIKATSFIPMAGEIIVYDADATYKYERFKIGDGVTTINNLPFCLDSIYSLDGTATVLGCTNQIRTSTDANGQIYNNLGFKNGIRWSSSGGGEVAADNMGITGFIPVKPNDVLRLKNVSIEVNSYIIYFNAAKQVITTDSSFGNPDAEGIYVKTLNNSNAAFIRLTVGTLSKATIATINEEIGASGGEYNIGWLTDSESKQFAPYTIISNVFDESGVPYASVVNNKFTQVQTTTDSLANDIASKAAASTLSAHTGNTTVHITAAERTKWNAAESNVQSNWTETDTNSDAYIKNKPSTFTPSSHASTATTYGVSSASNYGHAMASSTTPKMDGTAAVGSETAKFARGDHVHPTDTSRAAASDLTSHTSNTTVHITANERTKWNAAEQNVQSDWNVKDTASDAYIKNKPTIPTVNNATLTIQKNGTNVATFTANSASNATANITVPTKVSELTNDKNFVTKTDLHGVSFEQGSMSIPSHSVKINEWDSEERPYEINANGGLNITTGGNGGSSALEVIPDSVDNTTVYLGKGNAENGYHVNTCIGNNDDDEQTSIFGSTIDFNVNSYQIDGTGETKMLAMEITSTQSDECIAQTNVYGELNYNGSEVATKSDIPTGAAANKGVDTSIAAGSTSTNLPTSKAVAAFVEGKGYKTTDNDSKVTSVGNHYAPTADSSAQLSADASSSTAATWGSTQLVTGVNLQRDAKGHVTGVTVDSIKMPSNPDTNQKVKTGSVTFGASDTVEFVAGSNVSITGDATNKKITISSTDTNTDTHHTAYNYVGAADSASNAATSNGGTYLKLYENGTKRSQFKISGSGATTVTSDSSGNITISSTDNNTHNSHKVNSGYKADGTTAITSASASSGDITLGDSGVTAGEYGPTANATPGYGSTFNVPDIKVNSKGIVTSITNRTVKIPASDNSETTLTITDKSSTDTADLVYAVTNLVEGGTKGHTITPTYVGLPTKAYVDKVITNGVDYLGTVSALTGLSTTAGSGDFYRVSTEFTFSGTEKAHVGDILLATKDNPAQNATDWDLIHTEVDSNTWVENKVNAAGYVTAPGTSNANKVWKTDSSGNPGWRDDANTVYTHQTSGVTAGSYNKVTVDKYGHVTSGENPTTLSGHGITNAYTKTEVDNLISGTSHTHPYLPNTTKYAASSSVGGSATSADKLTTARTITLDTAVSATATSFDGSSNITIPVTDVKEAYLTWGGKHFKGDYGPIDAAMIPDLGANRLAFFKSTGIVLEASTDGGSSWTAVNNDTIKAGLFSTGASFYIGNSSATKTDKSKYMCRITLTTTNICYTVLNKFALYISTGGSSGSYCTIEARTKANQDSGTNTWLNVANKVGIDGWSGWNIINISNITTHGNRTEHYSQIRFTFGVNSHASTSEYPGLSVSRIMAFGGVGWTTPSNLAKYGSIYSYDAAQNATFPANVTATKFIGPLQGNADTATKLSNAVTFKTSSSATSGTPYDGSGAVTVTYSTVGAAPTSHASTGTTYGVSSDTKYGHAMASSTAPKAPAATASVGSETAKFARGDHVHPLQTVVQIITWGDND